MERLLELLAMLVIGAPVVAGLYGVLVAGLLGRSVVPSILSLAAFFLAYCWVPLAMISIQGWGTHPFDFYWTGMRVIFVPSPLIAGTVLGAVLGLRKGLASGWRYPMLMVLAGFFGFGLGALLSARIAAEVLARADSSSRPGLHLALAVGFYGPLLIGPLPMALVEGYRSWRARPSI